MRCFSLPALLFAAACHGPPESLAKDAGAGPSGDARTDAAPNPGSISFADVTELLPASYRGGVRTANVWGIGSGAAIGDVDGDGHLDLVLARCDDPDLRAPGGPTSLLLGGGSFADYTADSELAAQLSGRCAHAAVLGDYDRDGDLDLFVSLDGQDRLFENDGSGGFTTAAAAADVAGPEEDISAGALFVDVNADGWLDLYVLAHTTSDPPVSDPLNQNRLYLNLGGDSFTDVTQLTGAGGDGSTQAALAADLDGDGDLEIFVANDTYVIPGESPAPGLEPDVLLDAQSFDGEGRPLYQDQSPALALDQPRSSMGVALADLDRDGREEIYVTNWGPNALLAFDAQRGVYLDQATERGVELSINPGGYYDVTWGARFFDFDRDGSEELFLVNGGVRIPAGCNDFWQLDRLLRRPPGRSAFADITGLAGFPIDYACPPPEDRAIVGRGVFAGDLDRDGDDDLVIAPFAETFRIYRNDTPGQDHRRVRIRPRGTVSPPQPFGAVLEVELEDGRLLQEPLYAGGDTAGHGDRVLEIGIGESTIARADLRWPSGLRQRIDALPGFSLDGELALIEPAWLSLSARIVTNQDPTPVLTYRPVDQAGNFLGEDGAGREVEGTRSDGVALTFTDQGDGTYTAPLPHPGQERVTVMTVEVNGEALAPRLAVTYR